MVGPVLTYGSGMRAATGLQQVGTPHAESDSQIGTARIVGVQTCKGSDESEQLCFGVLLEDRW